MKTFDRLASAFMTGSLLIGGSTSALFASTTQANAAEGVKVDHLGVNNTLVRVTGDDKVLLLPVQESSEDAKIDVIVNDEYVETIYVRLAQTKTDFSVPYDLSRFKGKDVLLNIIANHNRTTLREAKDATCWKNFVLADAFDISNRETKWRPVYHHTPLWGWMNDPNGMFYQDGKWNLYFQWNPYGSKWQNMTWGHATSEDLINWKQEEAAIRPGALGSIFSGSSVIDHNNTAGFGKDEVIALYTAAGASQIQCMAHSGDKGLTFERFIGNPVLPYESEARDPNMFWNPRINKWNLVLAHPLEYEMLIFSSPDLKNWTYESSFGKGLGGQDGIWECPDLFELPVDGTDRKKWVFISSINPGGPFGGSATQYFIGDFDGHKFTPDTDAYGKVPTKWLDFGKDNYAAVSFSDVPDNRRVMIGWMSNWQYAADVPTTQFRSGNTVPRDMKLFTDKDGQIYMANVPSPELEKLRGKLAVNVSSKGISGKPATFKLPADNRGACEIITAIDARKASAVTLNLSNRLGENVKMVYNPTKHTISFDRMKSGEVDFSENFPAVTEAPTFEDNGKVTLRIFVDASSIEVFAEDGKSVMTNLVFPNEPYSTLSISAAGNAKASVKCYSF